VDRILTSPEVAKLLRVGTTTIHSLARAGKISAFKVRSDWRFSSEAIERLMQDGETIDKDPEQS
jgi:excisionase family DNA binding protein